MKQQEIADRIDTSWAVFRSLIDSVPESRVLEPVTPGTWSLRDIAGHIAWWENRAADQILGLTPSGPSGLSVDERNALEYARISELTYQEALAELEASHARIVQVVRDTPSVNRRDVEADTWEHYEEHGGDVRAWLEA
jgi:hypothetical protein